ncbi:MAG: DinB family protein [Vicinamibacterales bacterium]
MSLAQQAIAQLDAAQEYFNRSTRNLTEDMSTFAPAEGMMTVAQQMAHAAHTVDWFLEGAFRPEGFDMNWEAHAKMVNAYVSVAAARAYFDRACAAAKAKVASMSDTDLCATLPAGPIMGGAPRMAIFGALTDHTAHHRGALTVYARVKGIVPPMPYMDM